MSSAATFLFVLMGSGLLASAADHWDYGEINGPEHWGEIFPDCDGKRQSPIDLTDVTIGGSPYLTWSGYGEVPATMALTNLGHTVALKSTGPKPWITRSDGLIFQLDLVHFHWGKENHEGSEHSLHGVKFPLEMHAVHRHAYENGTLVAPAQIIVLTSLFKITSGNGDAGLDKFIERAADVVEAETATSVDPFAWSDLLHGFNDDFYWYEGSLTTPPCSEVVTFYVSRHDRKVSNSQMSLFRDLLSVENEPISGNFRPQQERNGRTVHYKP